MKDKKKQLGLITIDDDIGERKRHRTDTTQQLIRALEYLWEKELFELYDKLDKQANNEILKFNQ